MNNTDLSQMEMLIIVTINTATKKTEEKGMTEDCLHMALKLVQNLSNNKLYDFELGYWEEINENYKTGMGCLPISMQLHEDIESLIERGYLKRDSKEPLRLYVGEKYKEILQ